MFNRWRVERRIIDSSGFRVPFLLSCAVCSCTMALHAARAKHTSHNVGNDPKVSFLKEVFLRGVAQIRLFAEESNTCIQIWICWAFLRTPHLVVSHLKKMGLFVSCVSPSGTLEQRELQPPAENMGCVIDCRKKNVKLVHCLFVEHYKNRSCWQVQLCSRQDDPVNCCARLPRPRPLTVNMLQCVGCSIIVCRYCDQIQCPYMRCSLCRSFLKGPFPPCQCVCVDVCVVTLLHSSFQHFLSLSLTFPSLLHISFFSTPSPPPTPTSALYFFSLFSSLLSSSPLLGPSPAPSLQYVFSDEWGHWLAARAVASRAQVLRAQSVKWQWSPLLCCSVSSAWCETWSFSKDTLLPTVGQAAYSLLRIFLFWGEN